MVISNQEKPNIVIIHADQHRWDCIGAYGNREIQTPHIDSLANDGVCYTNSFCTFPVCTPSRYSMLTGLYAHQHMGYSNHCTIPHELATFPKILRESGYKTKAVGKMHFTPTYLDVGFDEMVLCEQDGPGRYDDDYHRWLRAQELVDGIDLMDQVKEFRDQAPAAYWKQFGAAVSDLDEQHHSTTWIGEKAVETIQGWENDGNLLMVGFVKPHHPFDPPTPWNTLYNPEELSLLPGWTETLHEQDKKFHQGYFDNNEIEPDRLRQVMAHYYGSISQIDFQVGKMLDLLRKKGLYDDALILYTSDHGEYMGFRHLLLKGGYLYDPLAKVPLIVKYPKNARHNEICKALVSTVDLAPTILSLAGCDPNGFMPGIDLTKSGLSREMIFSEDRNHFMVRTQNRKLLYNHEPSMCQFFNLEKDPLETENVYTHPDYQMEISGFIMALGDWMLFEAKTPIYMDLSAPVVGKNPIQDLEEDHEETTKTYYRKRMKQFIIRGASKEIKAFQEIIKGD